MTILVIGFKLSLWLAVAAGIAVVGEQVGGTLGIVLYVIAGMQVLGIPLVLAK